MSQINVICHGYSSYNILLNFMSISVSDTRHQVTNDLHKYIDESALCQFMLSST